MKIRSLPPGFFSDQRVLALSVNARYLLLGMTTRADDRGCLTDSAAALHAAVFAGAPDVDPHETLQELVFSDWALPFTTPDGREAHAISRFMEWQSFQRVIVTVPLPDDEAEADRILAFVGWYEYRARAPNTQIKDNERSRFARKDPHVAKARSQPAQLGSPVSPALAKDLLGDQKPAKLKKSAPVLPPGMIDRIAELWNKICGEASVGFAEVLKVSESRRASIHRLVREYPGLIHERAWVFHFLRIARTKRLVDGFKNDQRKDSKDLWRPDFEFAIRGSSFIKLHEGSYGEAALASADVERYGLKELMGKRFLIEIKNADSPTWAPAINQEGGSP